MVDTVVIITVDMVVITMGDMEAVVIIKVGSVEWEVESHSLVASVGIHTAEDMVETTEEVTEIHTDTMVVVTDGSRTSSLYMSLREQSLE